MFRSFTVLGFLAILIGAGGKSFALPPCPEELDSPWTDCIGLYTYPNGDKYIGAFKEGKRSGEGKYLYANGNKYEGQWDGGTRNGKGKLIFPNGNKYVGDFVDGKWTGKGTLTNYFGDKYVGDFKDGKRHGKGIVSSANGFNYHGIFENDVIVIGEGRLIKSNKPPENRTNFCPGARNARCPSPPKGKPGMGLSLGAERSGFSKKK